MSYDFNFVNNVLFNWRHRTVDGGDETSRVNSINNYFKPGPETPVGAPIYYRIVKADAKRGKNIAKEYGKSFILSTHLLGDVERVCDTVVILHQGRVLRQGNVAELRTRRQDRYRLQIQGDPTAFVEELRLEGVRLIHDNGRGELRVAVPPDWVTRAFFALADNHGVVLRGLQPDDEDLEELFYRVLSEDGTNHRGTEDTGKSEIRNSKSEMR